eukprot:6057297-Amphidinium_carterae.1
MEPKLQWKWFAGFCESNFSVSSSKVTRAGVRRSTPCAHAGLQVALLLDAASASCNLASKLPLGNRVLLSCSLHLRVVLLTSIYRVQHLLALTELLLGCLVSMQPLRTSRSGPEQSGAEERIPRVIAYLSGMERTPPHE